MRFPFLQVIEYKKIHFNASRELDLKEHLFHSTLNWIVLSKKAPTSYSITRHNSLIRIGSSGKDLRVVSATQRIQSLVPPHRQVSTRIPNPYHAVAAFNRVIGWILSAELIIHWKVASTRTPNPYYTVTACDREEVTTSVNALTDKTSSVITSIEVYIGFGLRLDFVHY